MGLHTVAGGELEPAVFARGNVGPRYPRHRQNFAWTKTSLAAKAEGLLEVWGNNCSIRSLKRNETPDGLTNGRLGAMLFAERMSSNARRPTPSGSGGDAARAAIVD